MHHQAPSGSSPDRSLGESERGMAHITVRERAVFPIPQIIV